MPPIWQITMASVRTDNMRRPKIGVIDPKPERKNKMFSIQVHDCPQRLQTVTAKERREIQAPNQEIIKQHPTRQESDGSQ